MSLRTHILIAAAVIIGMASIAVASSVALARAPAGTTRLHHHHHHQGVHHSGQVQHQPQSGKTQ